MIYAEHCNTVIAQIKEKMERLFKAADRRSAELVQIILASQAIPVVLAQTGAGRFDVLVAPDAKEAAIRHLDLYAKENPGQGHLERTTSIPAGSLPGPSFFLTPVMAAAALGIAAIHFLLTRYHLHDQAVFAFGAAPYFFGQGETFRAVTALLLHADAAHVLGNMAGLIILGSPLVRVTGPGTGSFFILAAGVTANLLSNSMGSDTRISIGASTAVMAAAGLLSSRQAIARLTKGTGTSPWIPLASGAVIMALFSQGERTDILAHVLGFGAGAFTGLMVFPCYRIWHRPFMEPACLILTLMIMGAAILAGLI